jgi:8-oxo-dGTP pyrophosphatase MutT (NUDIX family)
MEPWQLLLDGIHHLMLATRLRHAFEEGMALHVPLIERDSNADFQNPDAVEAAVLVAFTDRPDPGILLTQRPQSMRRHPGQVAFPGGRKDAEDADLVAAALREAQEEVGLASHHAEIIGLADPYRTITAYVVTPVVSVIPPDLPLVANQDEVEAIFEVPASFLFDPANQIIREVDWQGARRHYYEMHWGGRRIWGATAAMLVNLSRRIAWPP